MPIEKPAVRTAAVKGGSAHVDSGKRIEGSDLRCDRYIGYRYRDASEFDGDFERLRFLIEKEGNGMLKNRVPLRESNDIVIARQACREIARELGFGTADQTRLAAAVSEIGRNIIQYEDEGVCAITDESNRQESRIRIVIEYHGSGIDDLNKTIRGDLTTSRKPADGLRSAERLVHCFEAESEPGKTTITLTMKKR